MHKSVAHFYFLLFSSFHLFAQCPSSNFTTPSTSCINENINITNLSTNTSSYLWDFCSEDNLNKIPDFKQLSNGFGTAVHSKTISDGSSYYSFVPGWNTNSLYRLDFGNSITNAPTYSDLGNLNSAIENLASIDLVLENGNWYGLGVGFSNNALYRFSFGSSLANTPTVENITGSYTLLNPYDISIVKESNNFYALVVNYSGKSISKLIFGGSIQNSPIEEVIDISISINLSSITISMECNSIYGFVCDRTTSKIFKLDFSNSIANTPIIEEIGASSGLTFDNPGGVAVAIDGATHFLYVSSRNGDLYSLDFNTSYNNIPIGINLGNINSASKDWGIEFIKENSVWYMHQSNFSGKLFQYQFGSTCDASISKSKLFEPSNVYFSTGGDRAISLSTFDIDGSFVNTITKTITVSPSLAPQPSAQITGNCLSSPVQFQGSQLSGDIAAWNWDFGDGIGTSTLQSPAYTYSANGDYQVKLSVTDANGCNNLLIDTVSIYNEPVPDFSVPVGTICMNNPIAFTNTSTIDAETTVSWTWDFNGEGSSTERDPVFTFNTSGVKNITLTTSISGCANVIQKSITIEDAPTTTFSFNNACNTAATLFQDQTVGTNLTNWSWDFGDGNASIEQNPTHTYVAAGKYAVTLTVGNALGCSTTKVDTVYNYAVPAVGFEYDLPCSNVAVQFTDTTLVQDANIVAWEWDFGDPESANNTSTNQNPQHTYSSIGDYTVSLTAYSQFGCYDVAQATISVSQAPEVAFSWNKACLGDATTFEDLTNSFGMPINSWVWVIDGQIFTEQHPQYTFSTNGIHTVQLSVTTNNLCAQTAFQDIEINNPPISSFNYSESCTNDQVLFYDTTINLLDVVTSREWRIDGQVVSTDSTMQVPMDPGDYIITLSIMTLNGCEESISKNITISGSPQSLFSTNTELGAFPLEIIFNNQSLASKKYFWEFDDDNKSTSSEENPSFTFNEPGKYLVSLISENDINCTDTTSMVITVVEPILNAELTNLSVIEDNSKSKFLLRISNPGTILLNESNLDIVFELSDNVEIVEPFRKVIHAGKSINYLPDFSIGSNGNAKLLCVFLNTHNDNLEDENIWNNRQCHNFDNEPIISDIFPNPTDRFFNISVILSESQNVRINILSQKGKVLSSDEKLNVPKGLTNFVIDAQNYYSGIYYINVIAGDHSEVRKVIVDK